MRAERPKILSAIACAATPSSLLVKPVSFHAIIYPYALELCPSLVCVSGNHHFLTIWGYFLRPVKSLATGRCCVALDAVRRYVHAGSHARGLPTLHRMGEPVAANPVVVLGESGRVSSFYSGGEYEIVPIPRERPHIRCVNFVQFGARFVCICLPRPHEMSLCQALARMTKSASATGLLESRGTP
jgi:hypothetical protein